MILRLFCSTLLAFSLLTGCAANSEKQLLKAGNTPLSGSQIQTLVTNNPLNLESGDLTAQISFESNGRLEARSSHDKRIEKGQWQTNEDNQLCLKFSSWFHGDDTCFSLYQEPGSNTILLFHSNGALAFTARAANGQTPLPARNDTTSIQSAKSTQQSRAQQGSFSPSPRDHENAKLTIKQMAKNCPDCKLSGADLRNADLIKANLQKANLRDADLSGANLRRARLGGADLRGAKLQGTNLPGADLRDADLQDADFSGANLLRADFSGARLEGIILDNANLEGVTGLNLP